MENLAIDESCLNNHFSLHLSIIFFLNGWENLHYELGIERVKDSFELPLGIGHLTVKMYLNVTGWQVNKIQVSFD